jgi:hypothetical protein
MKMTRARLDGLYCLLFGSIVFIVLGVALVSSSKNPVVDFGVVYDPARCLIQHCDPYNAAEVLRVYQAEKVNHPLAAATERQVGAQYIYLPTAFSFTVPFAMLPWGPAHILWITLTIGSLIFASFLIWDIGADYAPIVSGVLLGFFLANSEVLVLLCNSAGISISLCVVAVWCFLRGRFVPAGILCLAMSLAIKPQDAGLVWLYYLLAGGVNRKRALQTLLATALLSLPAILWVWHIAPNWMREWHSNVMAFSAPGGCNDPSPAASIANGRVGVINLQAAVSVFWDNPRIYNPVSYLVCGVLLLAGAVRAIRLRSSQPSALLALASIAALSMLPVCHHIYDTKLLLLTVPACAMLWAEGGPIRWIALLVTAAGLVSTGDVPLAILANLSNDLHINTAGLFGQILTVALIRPTTIILLVISIFYLWVYLRRDPERG